MNRLADRLFGFVFFVALFSLILSSFLVVKSFNKQIVPVEALQLPTESQSDEPSQVLGVQETQACVSKEQYAQSINRFRPDVIVYFGTEEQNISSEQLLTCSTIIADAATGNGCTRYQINVSTSCVENLITSSAKFLVPEESLESKETGKIVASRIKDEIVNYEQLAQQVSDLFKKNVDFDTVMGVYTTIKPMVLIAPVIKDSPSTDGKIAERYIEFDGSRQLMFLWEKGKYTKFRMSGAFPEYNPVGVFTILNKSPLAWSSTANKWMPYWQAFTFDKKQRAMLGIHALVYWYSGFTKTGTRKIFEPESNIGKPRSTGCLRLTVADARKVFEWSKVGDMVVIHD